MNKKIIRILEGILFILIIIAFIYIGTKDFNTETLTDSEKFASEYSLVSSDNVFTYVTATDVYAKLKNGSAVIFMGFADNSWSGTYASILNEAAKSVGITEILYYDFYNDRAESNGTYQSIVLKLSSYLTTLDDGTQEIYAPTLLVIKDGKIMYYDNETAFQTGNISVDDYWTEYKKGIKLENLKTMLQDYLNN